MKYAIKYTNRYTGWKYQDVMNYFLREGIQLELHDLIKEESNDRN